MESTERKNQKSSRISDKDFFSWNFYLKELAFYIFAETLFVKGRLFLNGCAQLDFKFLKRIYAIRLSSVISIFRYKQNTFMFRSIDLPKEERTC